MSDTPRTDRARLDEHDPAVAVASECSELERELNAANERIKRLEEALEATAKVIGPPGKSTWVSDDELNHAWELYIKTKEAKP